MSEAARGHWCRLSPIGALMLSLAVAVGAAAPRAFADEPPAVITGAAEVIDGNTLIVNDRKLCLWGMDAPDLDQFCLRDGRPLHCGRAAFAYLHRMAHGQSVTCQAAGAPRDDCLPVTCATARFPDLGRAMVWAGRALNDTERTEGPFAAEQEEAKDNRRGLWLGQFDRPWLWREQGGMIIEPR